MNLFKQLYNKNAEFIKQMKAPFVAKKVKRMVESAIDSCVEEIIAQQDKFMKSLESVETIDLNEFKKSRRAISESQKDIEFLQELYKILFDEEYTVTEILDFEESVKEITKETTETE